MPAVALGLSAATDSVCKPSRRRAAAAKDFSIPIWINFLFFFVLAKVYVFFDTSDLTSLTHELFLVLLLLPTLTISKVQSVKLIS